MSSGQVLTLDRGSDSGNPGDVSWEPESLPAAPSLDRADLILTLMVIG